MNKSALKLAFGGLIVSSLFSCQKEEIPQEPDLALEVSEKVSMTASRHTAMLNSRSDFRFGACGQAIGPIAYTSVPIEEQMRLLKSMGMTCYRVSIMTLSNGRVTVPFRFDPMIEAAKEAGITILPMVRTVDLDLSLDAPSNYKRGFNRGKNFAALYKHLFTYYELGNELDLRCNLPGKAGKSVLSYDRKKFNAIAGYLKGMNNGIKSEDPDARTLVNAGWLRWGFIRKLEHHGVNFDIVAWHWYDEMENVAENNYNMSDITEELARRFDKPIWFTEIGVRFREKMLLSDWEERQSNFMQNFTAKCSKNPRVKAALLFELFDKPEKNSLWEKNYGLIKWKIPYISWELKKAARDLTIN